MKLIIRSNQDDNVFFEIDYDKEENREFALEQAINELGYNVIDEGQEIELTDEDDEFSFEEVNSFLNNYATRVQEYDNTDLMMDGCFCINYYGIEWYVNKNNSFYSEEDEEILDFLEDKYIL